MTTTIYPSPKKIAAQVPKSENALSAWEQDLPSSPGRFIILNIAMCNLKHLHIPPNYDNIEKEKAAFPSSLS